MHESIERKEAEKEAAYQGITVEEALAAHEQAEKLYEEKLAVAAQQDADEQQQPLAVEHPHAEQVEPISPVEAPNPKVTRVTPPEKQDPAVKFRDAKAQAEAKGAWGAGDEPPVDPGDKMRFVRYCVFFPVSDLRLFTMIRRNLPYKVSPIASAFSDPTEILRPKCSTSSAGIGETSSLLLVVVFGQSHVSCLTRALETGDNAFLV